MGYISELRKYVGHSPIMATSIMCIIYDKERGILFEKSADFGRRSKYSQLCGY